MWKSLEGYSRWTSACAFIFILAASACAGSDSHQNFKSIMKAEVGQSINNPYSYRNRYYSVLFVESKVIANGNVEEEFKFGPHKKCRVFFELNKLIEQVVGWRYEGNEKDCAILP